MVVRDELDDLMDEPSSQGTVPSERDPNKPLTVQQKILAQAEYIASQVAEHGWSQRDIAAYLHCSPAQVTAAKKKDKQVNAILLGHVPDAVPLNVPEPTEEELCELGNLERIRRWSRDGVSIISMAALLRWDPEKLELAIDRIKPLRQARAMGLAEAEAAGRNALYALLNDSEHKDHFRAVMEISSHGKQSGANERTPDEVEGPVTPEDIIARLRPK